MKTGCIIASLAVVVLGQLLTAAPARGDIVEYTLPNTNLVVTFQGSASVLAGGAVAYRHPKFGRLIFGLKDVKIYKGPTTQELFTRQLGKATTNNSAPEALAAAKWALHHGLLPQFHEAVDKAREIDPQNADAQRLAELRVKMDVDLGDSSEQERELREQIRNRGMKIKTSKHFIMLHDTPDAPGKNRKKSRSDERLELLETVYESFILKFYAQGSELDIPKERLKVVLFNDHQDYLDYATSESPELASASGFWNSKTNISVFYDHGTTEMFQVLQKLAQEFNDVKEEAIRKKASNAAEIVQMANTITLLVEVDRENSDIEVVSHEATHQMAGNTGLLPRHVKIPVWVHEGLATYFESPKEASWSGVGAVNEQRLKLYKALEKDREHSNIDFIVGDQIFSFAASHGARLHGYGQSWALTHFLMERYFEQLMTYYRRLGEMPPDIVFSPDLLTKMFNDTFKGNRRALDSEWRSYMRGLKTEIEEVTGR